jgi:hypothetical protein
MHPAISVIPNTFFYQILTDHPEHTHHDSSLADWYRYDWGHDTPVLLVDTTWNHSYGLRLNVE